MPKIGWSVNCVIQRVLSSKKLTDDAIIRDHSGSVECYGGLPKEYADFYDYHFYTDIHFFSDLLSQFAGSWREDKPWLFGEFCDYDEFRDIQGVVEHAGGQMPWWLSQNLEVNPSAKDERWLYNQQVERTAGLSLPFTNEQLVNNSRKSAYVYRKFVLECDQRYL
jgi:hypothetical protein